MLPIWKSLSPKLKKERVTMVKNLCTEATDVVQHIMGESDHYAPFAVCDQLGIAVITDKSLHKEGYLICSDGLKLIFVSSDIQNKHRQEFIVAHEVGHFLMHQNRLFCCSNISLSPNVRVNTSHQEKEANSFATELLAPRHKLLPLIPNRSMRLSDISAIADHFDISMSHAAIKCIQHSKAENETLLCYDGDDLKWFVTNGSYAFQNKIPRRCPIDISTITTASSVRGVWDDLFEGSVYQEVFHPYKNKSLVLLSGDMIDENYYLA